MAEKVIVSKSKLTAIANAIRSKTGSTENLTLDNMVTAINNISGGSTNTLKKLLDATKSCRYLFRNYTGTSVDDLIKYDDTENVTDMRDMFGSCSKLTTIPLLNTSKVTNMSNMFADCHDLQTIPQLNTSKVTDMSNMFSSCNGLQTIPLLDTSKATNMKYMFYGCASLTSIPPLDTCNATNMSNMFNSCTSLTNIPQLNTSKVTNMSNMFGNCYKIQTLDITSIDKITSTGNISRVAGSCSSLTKFIIRTMTVIPPLNTNSFESCYHFTGTVDSIDNPTGAKDGRIYVPDDKVEQLKTATNWSAYADIIVPLSTLQEE